MRLSFPDQTSAAGDPLPEYNLPPVIETSVGIQFDGLSAYTSLSAAKFWDRVRGDYPLLEEKEPLEPAFETFGLRDGGAPEVRFQLVTGAIQPRFFFITKDGSELIQLQRDRLFCNWRRVDDMGEPYPRYVHVRKRLGQNLEHLSKWAAECQIGDIAPTQCEALYVNRIPLTDSAGNKCGLSFIFPWLKLMGMTEDGLFRFRRRLHDESGEPVARLSFDLRYGSDQDGAREANFFLTVRGRPSDVSKDGCLDFIDAAREVIVRTFTETTSADAHKLWERTR